MWWEAAAHHSMLGFEVDQAAQLSWQEKAAVVWSSVFRFLVSHVVTIPAIFHVATSFHVSCANLLRGCDQVSWLLVCPRSQPVRRPHRILVLLLFIIVATTTTAAAAVVVVVISSSSISIIVTLYHTIAANTCTCPCACHLTPGENEAVARVASGQLPAHDFKFFAGGEEGTAACWRCTWDHQ